MRAYIIIGCVYIIVGCVIAVLAFYESHCARTSRSPKGAELRQIAMKSVKWAGALLLLLIVFTTSQILCKHFHIGFWVSFGVSVLISLGFLGCCFLFNVKHPSSLDDSAEKKDTEDKELSDRAEK